MEGLSNAELEGVSEADIEMQRKMEEFARNMPFLDRETTLGLASQAAGVELLEEEGDDDEEEVEASGERARSKNPPPPPPKEQTRERASGARAHGTLNEDLADELSVGERARDNIDALRLHYQTTARTTTLFHLARTALQNELQAYNTLHDVSVDALCTLGRLVLVGTHADILDAVLNANVTARYVRTPRFRDLLDRIRVHSDSTEHPSVYLNQIAGVRGQAPTANELLGIIRKLSGYVEGRDATYIAKIDRVHATSRTKEPVARRYMTSTNGISSVRQDKTRAFLAGLRGRCLAVATADRDKPMPGWLAEFGYTHATETRLKNHRNHVASNYIMNLVESALGLEYPQKYSVHQFVIFACTEPAQAAVAEIIFTRLGLAYTGNGGGFTHYPVGLSNDSAMWHASQEWTDWARWAWTTFAIEENIANESAAWARRDKERAIRKKIEDKIAADPPHPFVPEFTKGWSKEEKVELDSDATQLLESQVKEAATKLADLKRMYEAVRLVMSELGLTDSDDEVSEDEDEDEDEDQQEESTERERLENEMARLRQKLKEE